MDYVKRVEKLLKLPQDICNKCGQCCKVTCFKGGYSINEIIAFKENESDKSITEKVDKFLKYFEPITYKQAVSSSKRYVKSIESKFNNKNKKPAFFKCRYIDLKTNLCTIYEDRPEECRNYPPPHSSTNFHNNCALEEIAKKNWAEIEQILAELKIIKADMQDEKKEKIKKHSEMKQVLGNLNRPMKLNPPSPEGLCKQCGTCCRIAFNNSSFFELLYQANQGLKSAKDFLHFFKPHHTLEYAKKIAPEYYEDMLETFKDLGGDIEDLTFYHCKYIGNNNKCTIYEDRLEVCAKHPVYAWAIYPEGCGYKGWLFEIREQHKKFVRSLKEYFYIKSFFSVNGIVENVPVDEIKQLDIDNMPYWCGFKDFSPLINAIYNDFADLPVENITIEEFEELIKNKTLYWPDLYILT